LIIYNSVNKARKKKHKGIEIFETDRESFDNFFIKLAAASDFYFWASFRKQSQVVMLSD
jgi:hypothetical protein